MQNRAYRDIILWFFLALFIASAFMLGRLLWPFLSVIVMGTVVTSLFKPVYKFFSQTGGFAGSYGAYCGNRHVFIGVIK